MFNKKTIKDLEEKVQKLETIVSNLVIDEITRYLISKEDAIGINSDVESRNLTWQGFRNQWESQVIFYKKGTEPKCDYIKKYLDGKIDYMKDHVSVEEGGTPLVCNSKKK